MKVTIVDIAKQANVSVTTVSKILNNKAESIRPDTISRVQSIIKDYNYTPNSIARSLITKKTKSIGLVIPDISNLYFSNIALGAENKSNECGYNVIICNTDDNPEKEQNSIRMLKDKFVDGIILIPTLSSTLEDIKLGMTEVPFVLVDRIFDTTAEDVMCVCVDNVYGGYIATKFLVDHGHKRIGCIIGSNTDKNTRDRLKGFYKAMTEAKLPIDESLIIEGGYRLSGGKRCAEQLLYKKVDAVFVQNDLMACGVYSVFLESGKSIPEDISVIGYDNVDYARILTPALTTVAQPYRDMGWTASENLINEIEGQAAPNIFTLTPSLVVRNSVAVIKSTKSNIATGRRNEFAF